LFSESGLNTRYSESPNKIRLKVISKTSNWISRKFFSGKNVGKVIYEAAESSVATSSKNDRAATLKMITHLYRHRKLGGQDVWVYSPPTKHTKWIFDELEGDKKEIISKLNQTEELFSEQDKDHMSNALLMASNVSEKTKIELTGKTDKVKLLIKRWFLDENCGEDELVDALTKLTAGFNKIASSCGSNTLVFTDYPDWRARRDRIMGGAIPGGEGGGFPVIYIEGAFTSYSGNSGMLWTCARTIIHEFSHLDVSTEDHAYRHQGLKPKSSLPYAKTIDNADSWACFAIDLAGFLSETDRLKFLV